MICTFYSYKGGVGRSMALANVATIFYNAGFKVLLVDADLEAPGLERFFGLQPSTHNDGEEQSIDKRVESTPGLLELFDAYKARLSADSEQSFAHLYAVESIGRVREAAREGNYEAWVHEVLAEYLVDLVPNRPTERRRLQLLPAGRRDGGVLEYRRRLREFDWQEFQDVWCGDAFFRWLREALLASADVVLVDSRTGINEVSSMATERLADAVVAFCAPNDQNLDGCERLLRHLTATRRLSRVVRDLQVLLVPSRVEDRAETDRMAQFALEFRRRDTFSGVWRKGERFRAVDSWTLRIPYIPFFAFYERRSVWGCRESREQNDIEALKTAELARCYAKLAGQVVDIVSQQSASESVFDVFLLHAESSRDWAELIAESVRMHGGTACVGLDVPFSGKESSSEQSVIVRLRSAIHDHAQVVLVLTEDLITWSQESSLWNYVEAYMGRSMVEAHNAGSLWIVQVEPVTPERYLGRRVRSKDRPQDEDIVRSDEERRYFWLDAASFDKAIAKLVGALADAVSRDGFRLLEEESPRRPTGVLLAPRPTEAASGLTEFRPGITDARGWTTEDIENRLIQVKAAIEWDKTTGSAQKWWTAFESENRHRPALVLRLAEELDVRKATITEFFLAYVYSNTDNIQANLHYLDYTRLKRQEEEKKRLARAEAARLKAEEMARAARGSESTPPGAESSSSVEPPTIS